MKFPSRLRAKSCAAFSKKRCARSTPPVNLGDAGSSMIVLVLEFLQTVQIISQYVAVARCKAFVVGGLANGIDDIVQNAIIPAALIQIRLHCSQLLLGSIQAPALFVPGPATPHVLQISSHVHEEVGPPSFPAKAFLPFVIPILRGDA